MRNLLAPALPQASPHVLFIQQRIHFSKRVQSFLGSWYKKIINSTHNQWVRVYSCCVGSGVQIVPGGWDLLAHRHTWCSPQPSAAAVALVENDNPHNTPHSLPASMLRGATDCMSFQGTIRTIYKLIWSNTTYECAMHALPHYLLFHPLFIQNIYRILLQMTLPAIKNIRQTFYLQHD